MESRRSVVFLVKVAMNTVFLQIDAPRSSEQIKYHPQILATATECGTRTHMRIISDDGDQASTRTVRIVRLVSTGDSV